MLFQRLNKENPERIFQLMQANEANVAADDVVQLELTAASVDGVKIVQPNTGELNATVGIADAAIGNGNFGLVQIFGYRSTSRVLQTGTSLTLGVALGLAHGMALGLAHGVALSQVDLSLVLQAAGRIQKIVEVFA